MKKPEEILLNLFRAASAAKDAIVTKIVDSVVFPYFEAKHGKAGRGRTMRTHVAEKVEQSLSRTIWVLREEAMEDYAEQASPTEFIVGRVFPQSQASGQYTLRVVVQPKSNQQYEETLYDLEDFLQTFVPHDTIGFEDYDA